MEEREMKYKVKLSIADPGDIEQTCSISITISGIDTEAEAKKILGQVMPRLAKVSGQGTIDQ